MMHPALKNTETVLLRVQRKLRNMKRNVTRLTKRTVSFAGWVLWIAGTAAVTLIGPVVFHYDKECQLLEMQQQIMQSQQAAMGPVLN
ncbi:hypothetical protein BgAZ_108970 [Babesia gibsoni]|uniref:Mitochondrial import receptor subunit TOM22 n=1 Tax=Babesia gibsoni TaxID=33632 RepID=A0AAD8PGM1_BABGI|nr:hypothetical protein BgAZ_108970 [Babesia gibsoni]